MPGLSGMYARIKFSGRVVCGLDMRMRGLAGIVTDKVHLSLPWTGGDLRCTCAHVHQRVYTKVQQSLFTLYDYVVGRT